MYKKYAIAVFIILFLAIQCFAESYEMSESDKEAAEALRRTGQGVIFAKVNSVFHVCLVSPSDSPKGYKWQLFQKPDEKLVKFLGLDIVLHPQPREEIWSYQALRPGETKMIFIYAPPGDAPDSCLAREIITVKIKEIFI